MSKSRRAVRLVAITWWPSEGRTGFFCLTMGLGDATVGRRAPPQRIPPTPAWSATPTTACPTRRAGCSSVGRSATRSTCGSRPPRTRPGRRSCTRSRPSPTSRSSGRPRPTGFEVIGVMHSHTHTDAVPVAHRRRPGARPGLALRHRVAARRGADAAQLPHRRRRDHRGAGGRRRVRRRRIPTEPAQDSGADRHPCSTTRSSTSSATRRWSTSRRCRPNPRRPHPRQARGPEPRRLGEGPGGQVHDRAGREGRHRSRPARARSSSSRPRATPASPWR